ncbi:MAG: hypothetical protein ACWA5L_00475 [bacterium]
MTILCALYDKDEEKVWLGSNIGNLLGSTISPEQNSKWNKFSDWAIGCSGQRAAADLFVKERAKFPTQTDEASMVIQFMREVFDKYSIGESKDGYKEYGISGILAHRSGLIYDYNSNLTLSQIPENTFWARGSGMEYALGADVISKMVNFSAEQRISNALMAAIDLDVDCTGEAEWTEF